MRKKIVVLGAGMVGRAIAIDLSRDNTVIAVDRDLNSLRPLVDQPNLDTRVADLTDSAVVGNLVRDADIVVGAVPGFMGFQTLRAVIEAGKNMVDISFFPEDPFELNDLAVHKGVIAVMDAGVAPGMSNIILGHHAASMEVTDFTCYVGGLPQERIWPYEYKAPFSPIDVIEEYKRVARLVENGKIVTKPALSEPELINFQGVGTLEAFNTDGLRSLIKTMDIPNMKEKTLRYPGHIELMKVLRETGFFSEEKIQIGEQRIRPIDLTTRLLFPKWKLEPEELEFTLMNIQVKGQEDSQTVEYTYDLLDRYDPQTKTASMSRTTGYTCTAVTRLVLDGHYHRQGISPPEFVGAEPGCFEFILNDLEKKQVHYQVKKKRV